MLILLLLYRSSEQTF